MKKTVFILIVMLFHLPLCASRAYPYPVTVIQPDGSTITIVIHGDENGSYKTTLDGKVVKQGSDGFYRTFSAAPALSSERKTLFPSGGILTNYAATKSVVNLKTLVIPVQFSDLKFSKPSIKQSLNRLFNELNYTEGGATGSVRDYFRDNLGSFCNLTFDVCDIVTLPETFAYYGTNSSNGTDKNVKQLVAHACAGAHSAGVNLSSYDFDRDGYVDNVFIIFAGHNEAEGGGDNTIWPQSWNVSDMQIYYDGVKVSNFSLYSEYKGASGHDFAGIGTICHEYGHLLGLKDMYDINGAAEGFCNGLGGSLSLMDYGNYNNNGMTPPYFTVFERQNAGLITVSSIRRETEITVVPVQESVTAYIIPSRVPGEEFWLEYRDGSKWDEYIGGNGLVVYHLDKSSNQAGSMSAKMRWEKNYVNGNSSHPCATPVSSDGNPFSSVAGAFFPGANNVVSINSGINFPLMLWNGNGLEYGIEGINFGANGIDLKVILDDGWNLPSVTAFSISPGQTSAVLEWSESKHSSGYWTLEWRNRNSVEYKTVVIKNSTKYVFKDLIPGEEYICRLYYSLWNLRGKTYDMTFKTIERLSRYPLIGGIDDRYGKGDSITFMMLNLEEKYDSILWAVNGIVQNNDRFVFPDVGKYRITATIQYKDGSEETLSKEIAVYE